MIRNFHNSDIPSLTRVWRSNAERLEFDIPPIDSGMLERALVTRFDFQASDLMICEDNQGEIVAWCHRSKVEDATIGLIASSPQCAPGDIESLISETACDWIGPGVILKDGPVVLPHTGLPPQGFGVGVSQCDRLIRGACLATGYEAAQSLIEWTLDPARYRMPMNRATMMFRRSLRLRFEPRLDKDYRRASNQCHLETLVACGDDGRRQGTIDFLGSDHELAVMPPTRCLIAIEPNSPVEDGSLGDINAFILSSWIVEMAGHGVRSIATTLLEDSPFGEAIATMGFSPGQSGVAFRRSTKT